MPTVRSLQFSMRTLVLALTLLGIVCGLFGRKWYLAYREKRASDNVQHLGAMLVANGDGSVLEVHLRGPEFDDDRMAELGPELAALSQLKVVSLVTVKVSDVGLRQLHGLDQLEQLYLADTQTSPAGIAELKRRLPNVEVKEEVPLIKASKLAARSIFKHAFVAALYLPGDRLIASDAVGQLQVWDGLDVAQPAIKKAHEKWAFALAAHPREAILASGGGDRAIRLWNAGTLEPIGQLTGHADDVHAVAFDATGDRLYSTGDDRTLRVWDVESRTELASVHAHDGSIPSLAVSTQCGIVATGSRDKTIGLWKLDSLEPVGRLAGHDDDIQQVAISPDGRRLASASYDRTIRIWDLASRTEVHVLARHTDRVFAVAFSPDGLSVVSAGGDGTLRLWDAHTGELKLFTESASYGQRNISSLVFAHDGASLVSTAAEGNLIVWNAKLQPLRVLWGQQHSGFDRLSAK